LSSITVTPARAAQVSQQLTVAAELNQRMDSKFKGIL